MQAREDLDNGEAIEITEGWWEKLHSVPFVSCKYLSLKAASVVNIISNMERLEITFCTEHKGKTLHLLK